MSILMLVMALTRRSQLHRNLVEAVVNSVASQWHLHMVIKECAHKCNPHFDPLSIPDLKNESILDQVSQFQVARRGKNASACSCRSAAMLCTFLLPLTMD